MVFGALISSHGSRRSPGDAQERQSGDLEEMQGESLFAIVTGSVLFSFFTVMLLFATQAEVTRSPLSLSRKRPRGGGGLLGIVTGGIAYRAMRLIDDPEVLISLALVTATYAIAERSRQRSLISQSPAGLLVGYHGPRKAMSDRTQTYLFGLWTLIDEILNSVLFLPISSKYCPKI